MSESLYTFTPLQSADHFRLIDILPGDPPSPLQCTISEFSLKDSPKYEALSYAWGDASGPNITLNNRDFGITKGLEEALRGLRRVDAPRRIWIDAICINQADTAERNAQVACMKEIYRGAELVVAWIGEETEDSKRAMRFLREMVTNNFYARVQHQIDEAVSRDKERKASDAGATHPEVNTEADRDVDAGSETTEKSESSGSSSQEAADSPVSSQPSSATFDPSDCSARPEIEPKPDEGQTESSTGTPVGTPAESPAESPAKRPDETPDERPDESLDEMPEERPEERPDKSQVESPDETPEEKPEERPDEKPSSSPEPPSEEEDTESSRLRRHFFEWDENIKRVGHHLMTGFPILHYDLGDCDKYREFFTDARQADWEALDALLARPWWSRTWVVQEVWLSRNTVLQCGASTLEWDVFTDAMDYHESWDDIGYLVKQTRRWELWTALKRRYGLAIHISKKRLLGSRLADLLWNIWDRESSDPRDKVYAVLGLVGGGGKDGREAGKSSAFLPEIDYAKSFQRVYQEVASHIIATDDSLDLLLAANGVERRSGLPSWVPDWRREANEHRPALFINGSRMQILLYYSGSSDHFVFHGHGYSASGDSKASARFSDDLTVMHVRGLVLSSVDRIGPAYGDDAPADKIIEDSIPVVRYAEPLRDSLFAGTLHMGVLKKVLRGRSWYDEYRDDELELPIIENIMKWRRFFVSKIGHLCIGPAQTQSGDVIAVIAGCNFPMVLRPEGDSYAVVGEAYVHENMTGEVLKEKALSNQQPDWTQMSLH
ncbi:heterokaryon incompatibility protein-domain-containing protein [Xylariaceae sp. FL0662B]|nr:heterokaryon incompatibility protein-domain-containing protein [Xylariaceae sp. FL0662B]